MFVSDTTYSTASRSHVDHTSPPMSYTTLNRMAHMVPLHERARKFTTFDDTEAPPNSLLNHLVTKWDGLWRSSERGRGSEHARVNLSSTLLAQI